jgi:hypothetical protein
MASADRICAEGSEFGTQGAVAYAGLKEIPGRLGQFGESSSGPK